MEQEVTRRHRFGALRRTVLRLPFGLQIWRGVIGVSGLAVIVVGIILLPLPGPGWLIIFLGLGIWGTEFDWARRLLGFARAQVSRWTQWVLGKPRWIQLCVGALCVLFVLGILIGSWWLVKQF
jgi:uncharacterized protein (TIGR02611 family)